jgi:hypothetical protein
MGLRTLFEYFMSFIYTCDYKFGEIWAIHASMRESAKTVGDTEQSDDLTMLAIKYKS